jgi:hypothetical protein
MTASSNACVADRDLLGAALPLFNDDHLAAAVVTAIWTHMVDHVWLATGVAGHEDRHMLNEVVPAPVALAVARDSLFGQRSHR